jgi:hypothetical protein
MVKGGLNPETEHLIIPAVKAAGVGTALDPGDVVIEDTATAPDGFKAAATAATAAKAGVNVNRVEDSETELEVVIKGRVRVKAENAIEPNKFVKTGTAKGVALWISGTDAENMKKGYFAGMHDKPVTGSPAKLQDPQTLKAAAANDIIIVDWGLVV